MSFDPVSVALEPLEALVNHALEFDPGTRITLAQLAGKTLAVDVNFPPVSVTVRITEEGTVELASPAADDFNVKLSGNPVSLARLFSRASSTYSFAESGVTLEGEQELLRQLGEILSRLDIDWEQAMAGVIGDTPAHLAGQAVRSANNLLKDVTSRSQSGVGEFIREESGLTVSNTEARLWFDGVRLLSADTDRIAARISRLAALMEQSRQVAETD